MIRSREKSLLRFTFPPPSHHFQFPITLHPSNKAGRITHVYKTLLHRQSANINSNDPMISCIPAPAHHSPERSSVPRQQGTSRGQSGDRPAPTLLPIKPIMTQDLRYKYTGKCNFLDRPRALSFSLFLSFFPVPRILW